MTRVLIPSPPLSLNLKIPEPNDPNLLGGHSQIPILRLHTENLPLLTKQRLETKDKGPDSRNSNNAVLVCCLSDPVYNCEDKDREHKVLPKHYYDKQGSDNLLI